MSTSGTYSFSCTSADITRMAGLYIGKLGRTEAWTSQEYNDVLFALNMLVKQWMARQDFAPGLKMWTRQRGDLVLSSSQYRYDLGATSNDSWMGGCTAVSGTNFQQNVLTSGAAASQAVLTVGTTAVADFTVGDYVVVELTSGDIFKSTVLSIGASTVTLTSNLTSAAASGNTVWNYTTKAQRPEVIETALLRDLEGVDTPLDMMTLQTYETLPNKTSPQFTSEVTSIYYEPQLTNGHLYLDVGGVNDVTKILHIVYLRAIQDFVATSDNPEYPQGWYRALCWGLAKDIAPMFQAEWTREMQSNYGEALSMAQEANAETTEMYFQPNL